MRHPYRRYCFHLAEKLGKTIGEVMQLSAREVSEWMAYDLSKNEDWQKDFNKQEELARQRELSPDAKAKLFKQLLGG